MPHYIGNTERDCRDSIGAGMAPMGRHQRSRRPIGFCDWAILQVARPSESAVMKRTLLHPALGLMLLMVCLIGCQASASKRLTLADQIRGVGHDSEQGLQIFGLRNPIVTDLMEQALAAERNRAYQRSAMLLNEALMIEPDAPDILQQLAEVMIEQGKWADARTLALRSLELGPKLGHLCKRNYRALSVAYEQLNDRYEADKAWARVALCERSRPERF